MSRAERRAVKRSRLPLDITTLMRVIRPSYGITLEGLSRRTRRSTMQLSGIERGRRTAGEALAQKLAEIFGVPAYELLRPHSTRSIRAFLGAEED